MSESTDTKWAALVRRHAEIARTAPPAATFPDHRPDVAILACSDARVPPSVIFGSEPGSSFVVRLAGNSATAGAVASLTYAVAVLGVDLIVVLGHTGCGAVAAALDADTDPHFNPILTPIDEMLAACATCRDDLDAAVATNVRHNVERLRRDRGPLGRAIAAGQVDVRGAVHDLRSGDLTDIDLTDPTERRQP
jgi:carbonic anhydrase